MAGIDALSIIEVAVVALLILFLVYIILKIGKNLLKWVFGIIINSILGFVAIFLLNYFFDVGLPINLGALIATALFGLAAVGTMLILKLAGVIG